MVVVKLYLHFKEYAGRDELRLEGVRTPADVLRVLSREYPKIGSMIERGDFIVLLNGVPIPDKDLDRITLSGDDILEILPPASGGSVIHY